MTKQELLEERISITTKRITRLIREAKKQDLREHLFEAVKTVCAWCGRTISKGDAEGGLVSHGMCSTCARKAGLPSDQRTSKIDLMAM
jgi:hypothetical protein